MKNKALNKAKDKFLASVWSKKGRAFMQQQEQEKKERRKMARTIESAKIPAASPEHKVWVRGKFQESIPCKNRGLEQEAVPQAEVETEEPVVQTMSGYEPSFKEIKDALIIERLKKNAELIQAIEEEYKKEEKHREDMKNKNNNDDIITSE